MKSFNLIYHSTHSDDYLEIKEKTKTIGGNNE